MSGIDAAALRTCLIGAGALARDAPWEPLAGGRTNVVAASGGRVFKLFLDDRATPLFANEAVSEIAALSALRGSGIAPDLRDAFDSPWGQIVEMERVPGAPTGDPALSMPVLRALHDRAPFAGIATEAPMAAGVIIAGRRMLRGAAAEVAARVRAAAPADWPPRPLGALEGSAFLHGDPVPANVIAEPGGRVRLVDWQCPRRGSPVLDLACALSPSMRIVSGEAPLSEAEVDAALALYGAPDVAATFHAWRPGLTWRFACYAAWRMGAGWREDAAALEAELSLLERLRGRSSGR